MHKLKTGVRVGFGWGRSVVSVAVGVITRIYPSRITAFLCFVSFFVLNDTRRQLQQLTLAIVNTANTRQRTIDSQLPPVLVNHFIKAQVDQTA